MLARLLGLQLNRLIRVWLTPAQYEVTLENSGASKTDKVAPAFGCRGRLWWVLPSSDMFCAPFWCISVSTVREITKSSSTFSATNNSSNIVWLLQLHDTIQMETLFVTKFSNIYLAKGEKRLVFQLSFVNLQRAKNGTHMFGVKYRYVSVVLISSNRTLGIMPL